jgi:hypothetical protein
MTPKEKALELVNKYYHHKKRPLFRFWKDISNSKDYAIIAVNEILNALLIGDIDIWDREQIEYWYEVKLEIENL